MVDAYRLSFLEKTLSSLFLEILRDNKESDIIVNYRYVHGYLRG